MEDAIQILYVFNTGIIRIMINTIIEYYQIFEESKIVYAYGTF